MSDPEIEAMSVVADALIGLPEEAQGRVLRWAADRFNVVGQVDRSQSGGQSGGDTVEPEVQGIEEEASPFAHFAELFAAASPKTYEDKALVAAYWVQVHAGKVQWQSRTLNAELKHLGHAVPNITLALTQNIRKKPQRVIQLRKAGNTKQANKTYKVTNEGIVYVQGMLNSGSA